MALLKELIIPHPRYDPDGELNAFYTAYYKFSRKNQKNMECENREDSPDESRESLIKRVHPFVEFLPETSIVLDLGAGRQIFERGYEDAYGRPKCQIVSVDIANIRKEQLLAQDYPHIQVSGRNMPFRDEVFEIAISNMAFDFMLPEVLPELHRVTKPGAQVFLNLHHPSLVQYDINRELTQVSRKIKYEEKYGKKSDDKLRLKRAVFLYHRYLRDSKVLFETDDQIKCYFNNGGFEVLFVNLQSDLRDKWWEVDLIKNFHLKDSH